MQVKHGASIELAIATGRSRKETKWKNITVTWAELVNKLSQTHRTHETVQAYKAMPKDDQDQIKDVGGFVGGHLKEGRRRNGYVVKRSVVSLDVDYATPELWDEIELFTGYAMACYSTHKHTPQKPRYRLVIPLSRTVGPDEYQAIARKIADTFGMDYFDDTTYEPTRLMYWPSTSKDGEYFFQLIDAPILNPDDILAQYHDWQDVSFWPESSRMKATRQKTADKQGDPLEKPGLIGAFCRTYTIHEAIDKFIPDTYLATSYPDRFSYAGGSTAAGLVVYDEKFAYSNHGTDPISGQLCNAFDLIRIHKFGELDDDAKEGTPTNRLPSWQKMMDLINEDDEVKLTIGKDHLEQASLDFQTPIDDEDDLSWMKQLTTKKNGEYEVTIENMLLIINNDPNLKGIGAHNLFNDRCVVTQKMPWPRTGEFWTDIDDASLRNYFESVYHIEGRPKLIDALTIAFEERAYHPVRDYLNRLTWDGTPRLETMLIEYLGADDNHYVREVTRKTMVAAITRVFHPGCKFDYILTFNGDQGIGKSYLFGKLGMEWFSDSLTDIRGKEAYEALDGVWIMEIGELAAFRKQDREAIKNYISKQTDTYRKAYARNVTVNKRQSIFIGTVNDYEFLNDPTGARRFWIVDVHEEKRTKTVWDNLSQDEVDQIWAEAMECYKNGENIMRLDAEADTIARMQQEVHSERNTYIGIISEFLEKPIPRRWNDMTILERQQWINASEDFRAEQNEELTTRDRITAAEIWVECFQKDAASLTKVQSRVINEAMEALPGWKRDGSPKRYGVYGTQRGFYREDIF